MLNLSYHSWHQLLTATVIALLLLVLGAASIAVPGSNCYTLDNSSHIIDFTSWIGHLFEYEGKDSDLVVRFCKDVESRSQKGYIDFGRFDAFNYLVVRAGHINFVQDYYKGDLMNCERTYSKLGRTAQVNIICGSCLNGRCKGEIGCICNVTFESSCRVLVELSIPCERQGPRVFEGFTLGFHPRSWEIVYNGMTQLGFEKSHHEFREKVGAQEAPRNLTYCLRKSLLVLYSTRFSTEQTQVALYMTAVASMSRLVQKPTVKIFPESGLEVRLSGSGAAGRPPTTLSPTILIVDWTCVVAQDTPFEVEFTIPVENYEPIQFTLTKFCEYQQNRENDVTGGWAILGVLSFMFLVSSTLFCCGGFVYKARYQNQRGLDALPGMTLLSVCLQTVTGPSPSYTRAEDYCSPSINQASLRQLQDTVLGTRRQTELRYGSI